MTYEKVGIPFPVKSKEYLTLCGGVTHPAWCPKVPPEKTEEVTSRWLSLRE